ncbi:methyltransferase [Nitzschia inconspicua]|uniref:Methyltransferase n=1 Tax=Nitzschia inconspicua TaxID=303405 RepID=A0A9K3KLN8_9STRA|nr:methyltransferase [Nitzschia inconspicua]
MFPSASNTTESKPRKTRYTIDDSVCPPTKSYLLEAAVQKACRCLPLYLQHRPIDAKTRQPFQKLLQQLATDLECGNGDLLEFILTAYPSGIILDSGCGTGRSTRFLASEYPENLVLGIDRSIARLTKSKDNRKDGVDSGMRQDYVHRVAPNAYLIRAELVDFWRCCIDHDANFWTNHIFHHYILYPNPYPTPQRLTQRWYAHSSFPLLLHLNAHKVVVRSNWEAYLKEFSMAVEIAYDFYNREGTNSPPFNLRSLIDSQKSYNPALPYLESAKLGPHERTDKLFAWTNFEAKYDKVEERTFELVLHHQER